jgi:hypothetical protein
MNKLFIVNDKLIKMYIISQQKKSFVQLLAVVGAEQAPERKLYENRSRSGNK